MEKLLGSLFFYSLTLAAFCQNNKILLLKDLPIIYNLDSLEKDVAETKKTDKTQKLNTLLLLEFSRFVYSSIKFVQNLNDLQQLTNSKKYNDYNKFYELFKAIDCISKRHKFDSALNICRATACFSKADDMHYGIIKTYIH